MRTIYIDKDFKCHVIDDGTMVAVEMDFFDGKCDEFVEGYCFVPNGETWTDSDGTVFHGEMIFPWKSFRELDTAQRTYEKQLLEEYKSEVAGYESAITEIEAALGCGL